MKSASESFCTVEAAAKRLQVHPKTVLRFIRDGRLRAMKVGRQYRILVARLDELLGVPTEAVDPPRSARTTVIVDIPDADATFARRAASLLTAAGATGHAESMRVDVAHDPARRQLKVVAVGDLAGAHPLLQLVEALLAR